MKKYNIVVLLIASLIFIPSCTEDDLDTTVYGGWEDKEFYSTMDEMRQALTICYYHLKYSWNELNATLLFVNDVGSDDCDKGGADLRDNMEWTDIETFNIKTDNGKIEAFWKVAYLTIYQVNVLLENIDRYRGDHPEISEKDAVLLTQYENEARWIRGVYYFQLAYLWGDVPVYLKPEKLRDVIKPRVPVDSVWQVAINDFTAATKLPKRSEYIAEDLGRVTSGAAYAMLGRTHWFRRDFEKAKSSLSVLVEGEQKGEYELDPDYATQWLNHNSNAKESIFEIQYKTNGKSWDKSTGWNGVWFIPNCDGGYGFHVPTQQLLNDFDIEDPRITWTFIKQGDKFEGNSHTIAQSSYPNRYFDRKHFVPISETLNAASPVYTQDLKVTNYIIRYADVLLMYAECNLEAGNLPDARKYLNKVRERARNSSPKDPKRTIQKTIPATKPTSLPDIVSSDVQEVRLAIWRERRCELACEGLRRMDLVQQQRYGKVMTDYYNNNSITKENPEKGRYYSDKRLHYPIPLHDVEISNGVLSNPDY